MVDKQFASVNNVPPEPWTGQDTRDRGMRCLIAPHFLVLPYERQIAAAGLHKLHGLRHAYAQERYRELTGRAAPAAGGRPSAKLAPKEKVLDRQARATISRELGHVREQITRVYLGR